MGWHYPPDVPEKEAQYLIEQELRHLNQKPFKTFSVDYYFVVKLGQNCNYSTGWQSHPNGKGIIRWMEIPE